MVILILPWVMESIKTQQEGVGESLAALDCSSVKLEIKSMVCNGGGPATVLIDNRGIPVDYLMIRTYDQDGSVVGTFPTASEDDLTFAKENYAFGELEIKNVIFNNVIKDGKLELIPVINEDLVCSKNTILVKTTCDVVCVPNCDCAVTTNIGETCADGCGGDCHGTKEAPACVDTDVTEEYQDGINIYQKGIVTTVTTSSEDFCSKATSIFGGTSYVPTVSCSGSDCYIEEKYCNIADSIQSTRRACSAGCNDGVCIELVCTDTDVTDTYLDGINIYQKGVVTTATTSSEDSCRIKVSGSWGSISYNYVASCSGIDCYIEERYCNSLLQNVYIRSVCSTGCNDGVCQL